MTMPTTQVPGTSGYWPGEVSGISGAPNSVLANTAGETPYVNASSSMPSNTLAVSAHQVRANRAKRGIQFWFGIALLVAGLAIGGRWLWNAFGTTHMVQATQQAAIEEFTARLPLPITGDDGELVIAEPEILFTDFDLHPPPTVDMASLELGEVFGLLTVPSWNELRGSRDELLRNRILVKQGGTTEAQTNRILNTGAAAHYTDTVGPGQIGNFSLSAHRRSYGDNFLHLPDLQLGDYVLLETEEAWYIYRVIDSLVVLPTNVSVINPDPFTPVNLDGTQFPSRRLLTMTTCTGEHGSPWRNTHRWIVHAELESWMYRTDGIPPMIDHYWEASTDPYNS